MAEQMCSTVEWSNGVNRNQSSCFKFLLKKAFCDCTLKTDDGKEIFAHRIILASTSLFFRKKLEECPNAQAGQVIRVPNISYLNLSLVLKLIYKGEVTMAHNRLAGFLNCAKALGVGEPADFRITQKPRSEVERKKSVRSKLNITPTTKKRPAEDGWQANDSKKRKLERSDRDWSEDSNNNPQPPEPCDNRKRKPTAEEELIDLWDPQPTKRFRYACQMCHQSFADMEALDLHEMFADCTASDESFLVGEDFADDDNY